MVLSETALFVKQFKGKCRNCGKQGHKSTDCWENENNKHKRPNNYKQKKNGQHYNNPNIICYNCNEKGHIKSKYPKLNTQTKNAMVASSNEVVLMTAKYSDIEQNVWIGDTGASNHMMNT